MFPARRNQFAVCAAAFAIAATAAGCTSSAGSSTQSTPSSAPITTSVPANTDARSNTITIKNFAFGAPITVKAGSVVTVVNVGNTTHTLSADDGTFDTGPILGGKTVTFDAPMTAGAFKFHCNIHDMHGTLIVTD